MTHQGNHDDGPIASGLVNFGRELSAGQIAYCVDVATKRYHDIHRPSFRIDRRYQDGDLAVFGASNRKSGLSVRITANTVRVGSPYFRFDYEGRLYTQAIVEDFNWFPDAPALLEDLPVGAKNRAIVTLVEEFIGIFSHITAVYDSLPAVNGLQGNDMLNFPTMDEMCA
jgi:hypothetical protein